VRECDAKVVERLKADAERDVSIMGCSVCGTLSAAETWFTFLGENECWVGEQMTVK
jgi:hypothetical protein